MPEDVDYINAHGTSTAQNDVTETRAIKEVFGKRAKEIPVSSNKSMLGHTIAAAGAIEMILTLMGIDRSILLPTINHEFPDPKCDLDYVPNEARNKEHRIALSNSFGFGGQNACLCVGKFIEEKTERVDLESEIANSIINLWRPIASSSPEQVWFVLWGAHPLTFGGPCSQARQG